MWIGHSWGNAEIGESVCGTKRDTCQFNLVDSSVMPTPPRPSSNQWPLLRVLWILIWPERDKDVCRTHSCFKQHENLRSRICQKPQKTEWNWQMFRQLNPFTEKIVLKGCITENCLERISLFPVLIRYRYRWYGPVWGSGWMQCHHISKLQWETENNVKMLPVNQSFHLLCNINVILKSALLWRCF